MSLPTKKSLSSPTCAQNLSERPSYSVAILGSEPVNGAIAGGGASKSAGANGIVNFSSCGRDISPYNATKKTNVCNANPTAVGQPPFDDTVPPNNRLLTRKDVGLPSKKNSSVVYSEYLNFRPSESAIILQSAKSVVPREYAAPGTA